MPKREIVLARAADTLLDQDKPLSPDEARALDLLLSFNQEQLEIMIKILDLAFGPEQ